MAQNVEEVREQLTEPSAPVVDREEILRRAGVRVPTGQNMAPFRAVPRRPSWLAFLLRLVRYPD